MHDFEQAQLTLTKRGTAEAAVHAAALFRRAADRHNALAAYDLAYCYENGLGVPLDRIAAYTWFGKASAAATHDTRLREMARTSAAEIRSKLDPNELRQAASLVLVLDLTQGPDQPRRSNGNRPTQ